MIILLFIINLLLLVDISVCSTLESRCLELVNATKRAHEKVWKQNSSWWYTIGLFITETRCKWLLSKDGHGSIGYGQITPKYLDNLIRPYFPDYDKEYSQDHFNAVVFILRNNYKNINCKYLWKVYHSYNGGFLVNKECERANSCKVQDCRKECKRKDVCVNKIDGECIQYRNACDISYSYVHKVYSNGLKFKPNNETDIISYWSN